MNKKLYYIIIILIASYITNLIAQDVKFTVETTSWSTLTSGDAYIKEATFPDNTGVSYDTTMLREAYYPPFSKVQVKFTPWNDICTGFNVHKLNNGSSYLAYSHADFWSHKPDNHIMTFDTNYYDTTIVTEFIPCNKFKVHVSPEASGTGNAYIKKATFPDNSTLYYNSTTNLKEEYYPPSSKIKVRFTHDICNGLSNIFKLNNDTVKVRNKLLDRMKNYTFSFNTNIYDTNVIAAFELYDKYLKINYDDFFPGICINSMFDEKDIYSQCFTKGDEILECFREDEHLLLTTNSHCSNYQTESFTTTPEKLYFSGDTMQEPEYCYVNDASTIIPDGCYDTQKHDLWATRVDFSDFFDSGLNFDSYWLITKMNNNKTINVFTNPLPDGTPCMENGGCASGYCRTNKILTIEYNEDEGVVLYLEEQSIWPSGTTRNFTHYHELTLAAIPKNGFGFTEWCDVWEYCSIDKIPYLELNNDYDWPSKFYAYFDAPEDNFINSTELASYIFVPEPQLGSFEVVEIQTGTQAITHVPNVCGNFVSWVDLFGNPISTAPTYSVFPNENTRFILVQEDAINKLTENIIYTFNSKNHSAYASLYDTCDYVPVIKATAEAFNPENSDPMIKFIDASIDDDYLASLILMEFLKKQIEWNAKQ